jgi:hypothetical protein
MDSIEAVDEELHKATPSLNFEGRIEQGTDDVRRGREHKVGRRILAAGQLNALGGTQLAPPIWCCT